jgi:superfamily I DNA/RNA helicase
VIPNILLGPPGTGKTKSLLDIVEEELSSGVRPNEIGVVTFTKRGANEFIQRACAKFGLERADFRYFRTIHSWCFQALGLNNGDILEGKKVVEFGDWIGEEISEIRYLDEGSTFGFTRGDRALFMENLARVRCIPLRKQYDSNFDDLDWEVVDKISRGLAQFKKDRGLVDYTDMLSLYVERGTPPCLKHLIVDECQDLSQLQWRVIFFLAKSAEKVTIAGDDDQAIYKWAGADVDFFINLAGNSRVLGQSYRVPRRVQLISSEIIAGIRNRRPKVWNARVDKDSKIVEGRVSRVQQIYDVDLEGPDVLILGRNAYVLQPMLNHLRREGIVFNWRGYNSVNSGILEAIVGWEKLRQGGTVLSDEARKIYEYLSSGRGVKRGYKTLPGIPPDQEVSLEDLKSRGGLQQDGIWHEALDRIPEEDKLYILRARRRGEQLKKKPRVTVSTIHGAKGGQGEHVILLRDMASRTYQEFVDNPEDEHRVWYVGVTRALERLTIVAPKTNRQYDV